MDDQDEVTCAECGEVWPAATARFCGRCGARLEPPNSARGRVGRRRSLGLTLGLAVTVVGGGVVASFEATWPGSESPEETATGVELPGQEEVAPAGSEPQDRPAVSGDLPRSPLTCAPSGCELWRIEGLLTSHVTLDDQLLFTVDVRSPGRTTDGLTGDEPVEVAATATSLREGVEVWRTELRLPGEDLTDRPSRGRQPSMTPAGDLFLIGIDGVVVALDRDAGGHRWSVEIDHDSFLADRGPQGEVVLWTQRHGPGGTAGDDDHGEIMPPAGVVHVLDEQGTMLWELDGYRIVTLTADALVLLDLDHEEVVAVDLRTGEPRWERVLAGNAQPDLLGHRGAAGHDRSVLFTEAGIEIIDPASGEAEPGPEVSPDGGDQLMVAGDVLVVRRQVEASDEVLPAGPVPSPLDVYDLTDPDADPRRVEGVVDVVPLVTSGWRAAVTPWQRPEPVGLGLLAQASGQVSVEVLDADGSRRWSQELDLVADLGLSDEECCVRLAPSSHATSLLLVPSGDHPARAVLLSSESGDLVDEIDLRGLGDAEHLLQHGELFFAMGTGDPDRMVLVGPAGRVTVDGGSFPRSILPTLVIEGGGRLIAIDTSLLY